MSRGPRRASGGPPRPRGRGGEPEPYLLVGLFFASAKVAVIYFFIFFIAHTAVLPPIFHRDPMELEIEEMLPERREEIERELARRGEGYPSGIQSMITFAKLRRDLKVYLQNDSNADVVGVQRALREWEAAEFGFDESKPELEGTRTNTSAAGLSPEGFPKAAAPRPSGQPRWDSFFWEGHDSNFGKGMGLSPQAEESIEWVVRQLRLDRPYLPPPDPDIERTTPRNPELDRPYKNR